MEVYWKTYHCLEVKSFSRVRLFATPWTVTYQAPLPMGFFRQDYWSGLPFPSPGDLPSPGIEPRSPALQADALTSEPLGKSFSLTDVVKTSDPLMNSFPIFNTVIYLFSLSFFTITSVGFSERKAAAFGIPPCYVRLHYTKEWLQCAIPFLSAVL